jgi:hypothetical protein
MMLLSMGFFEPKFLKPLEFAAIGSKPCYRGRKCGKQSQALQGGSFVEAWKADNDRSIAVHIGVDVRDYLAIQPIGYFLCRGSARIAFWPFAGRRLQLRMSDLL